MAKSEFAVEHKIVALAIIGIIVIAGLAVWTPAADANRLDVSGSAVETVDPDEVQVVVGAEAQATTAAAAQQQNADIISRIRANLAGKGLTEEQIETVQFSVQPVTQYNPQTGASAVVGYSAVHLLKITSSAISRAGEYVDAASVGGANRVDSIAFTLSTAKEYEVRQSVLGAAAANARSKADGIAQGLGVRVTRLVRASEGYFYIPYAPSPVFERSAGAPTVISPGQLEVSASVSATFEIG